jgi:hypothetical protein
MGRVRTGQGQYILFHLPCIIFYHEYLLTIKIMAALPLILLIDDSDADNYFHRLVIKEVSRSNVRSEMWMAACRASTI